MKKVIKAGLMALLVFVVGACDEKVDKDLKKLDKDITKTLDKAAKKLAEVKCVDNSPAKTTTFKDPRDGKTYKVVTIGKQTWMAQNLDYHGEDGFLGLCRGDIPSQKIRKPENCEKYGRLYDGEEAMKACSKGWHLPSEDEWYILLTFAGGESGDKEMKRYWTSDGGGRDAKKLAFKKLSSQCGWENCGPTKIDERGRTVEGNCTNELGFSALSSASNWWNSDVSYSHVVNKNRRNSVHCLDFSLGNACYLDHGVPGDSYVRCIKD